MNRYYELSKIEKDLELTAKIRDKKERLIALFGPVESYVLLVERILVWELPYASAVLLIAIHLLFWLATAVRIYYLFGVTCMILIVLELWVNYLMPETSGNVADNESGSGWTELDAHLLGVPELSQFVAEYWVKGLDMLDAAIELRASNRPRFFVLSIIYLSIFAVFGAYIPGIWISYIAVMGLIIWPCLKYHNVYDRMSAIISPIITRFEQKLNIKRSRTGKKGKKSKGHQDVDISDSDDAMLDEFIPPVNPNILSTLTSALDADAISEDEDNTGHTPTGRLTPQLPSISLSREQSDDELLADEESSLTHGLGVEMPSINDVDGTMDEFSLGDRVGDASIDPDADDNNSDVPNDAVTDYFRDSNSNSNSEGEEENFTAGLVFSDDPLDLEATGEHSGDAAGVLSGILGQGGSALAAALKTPALSGIMTSASSGLSAIRDAVGIGRQANVPVSEEPGTSDSDMLDAEFEFLNQEELNQTDA